MNAETALITGASSGIGLHLAREFASHGHRLILVAPVAEELEAVARDIRAEFGVLVESVAKDLEEESSAQDIFDHLRQSNIAADILVNNAGHGFRGKSWEIPIERSISIVRLNIEAVLRLTALFLPPMITKGSGKILNTASIAGFEPGPNLNVYHASKAFVLSWSEALAVELEGSGVTVTALCPGATDTDFFPKAGMQDVKAFQSSNVMAPQEVAQAGYKGLMSEELFVVPGAMNKALVAARRVLPEKTQAKMNKVQYEEVPPEKQKRQRGDVEKEAARTVQS
jgi:short-subunit dehydrogenase